MKLVGQGMIVRAALAAVLALPSGWAAADEALWSLLRGGGQVVLVRHALTTPGVGDPEGMKLEDCASQRNLSEEGRKEAAALGAALRARAVPVGAVVSSPWCRCLETARIALGVEAGREAALGNLFGRRDREAQQVAQLRGIVARKPERGNAFFFTHGSTTLALTGVSPATAEMVILTPQPGGAFKLAGRLAVR